MPEMFFYNFEKYMLRVQVKRSSLFKTFKTSNMSSFKLNEKKMIKKRGKRLSMIQFYDYKEVPNKH